MRTPETMAEATYRSLTPTQYPTPIQYRNRILRLNLTLTLTRNRSLTPCPTLTRNLMIRGQTTARIWSGATIIYKYWNLWEDVVK